MRNSKLDILKGIGIISVVIGHAFNTDIFFSVISEDIKRFVYIYHLPVFFLCSGFLFNENKTFISLLKSIWKKYIKFIIIVLSSLLLLPLWYELVVINDVISVKVLVTKIFRILLFRPSGIFVHAMYFIPFLCFTQFLYWICIKFIGTSIRRQVFIIILAMIIGVFLTENKYMHYYNINISVLMLPIMFLGKYMRNNCFVEIGNSTNVIWLVASFLLITIMNKYFSQEIDLSRNIIYGGYLFYPIVFIGLIFSISLSEVFMQANSKISIYVRDIVKLCGRYSLYIMAYHFIAFKLIDGIYGIINNTDVSVNAIWPIAHPELRLIYVIVGCFFPILGIELFKRLAK
ncbi:MAG: acyltransferase family protein [Prevotella sp.]|nr:acyltransferase family protein [Prevotella sp.]